MLVGPNVTTHSSQLAPGATDQCFAVQDVLDRCTREGENRPANFDL